MKKKAIVAVFAATTMVAGVASAGVTTNMENPLFIPKSGQITSKTGLGVMYKKADHTEAMKAKHHDGAEEFPVWRFTEEIGLGITDRFSTYVSLGWTQNDDIDRKGMHRARLGLSYRLVETLDNIVWDLYGEGYMAGLQKMKGEYDLQTGFKYDNFSNGRWGAVVGTRFGKRWSNFTASLFAEYLQTFGNHNNKIRLNTNAPVAGPLTMGMVGFPDEISVDLKRTKEITVGTNAFYQINDAWSFGGGFRFVEHTDNGVKSIHTKLKEPQAPATTAHQQQVVNGLLAATSDMNDGWDEYILSAVVSNQITDTFQLSLFGEYTFDHAHKNSANGTDVKVEAGIRANIRF